MPTQIQQTFEGSVIELERIQRENPPTRDAKKTEPVASQPAIEPTVDQIKFNAVDILARGNPELTNSLRRIESEYIKSQPTESLRSSKHSLGGVERFQFKITVRGFFPVQVSFLALVRRHPILNLKNVVPSSSRKTFLAGKNPGCHAPLEALYDQANSATRASVIPLFSLKACPASDCDDEKVITAEQHDNDKMVLATIVREAEKTLIKQKALPSKDDLALLTATKNKLLAVIQAALDEINDPGTSDQPEEAIHLGSAYDVVNATDVRAELTGSDFEAMLTKIAGLFQLAKSNYASKAGFFSSFFGGNSVLSQFNQIGEVLASFSSSQQDEKTSSHSAARGLAR